MDIPTFPVEIADGMIISAKREILKLEEIGRNEHSIIKNLQCVT